MPCKSIKRSFTPNKEKDSSMEKKSRSSTYRKVYAQIYLQENKYLFRFLYGKIGLSNLIMSTDYF